MVTLPEVYFGEAYTVTGVPFMTRFTVLAAAACTAFGSLSLRAADLDEQLQAALQRAGFTGKIESTLTVRLGRPLDGRLRTCRNRWPLRRLRC